MNNNGRFRHRKIYFTQVSNVALRDTNLSLKAKGLYALIQSYITLEDFTLYKTTLLKDCKEGEKAFESAWKELKDAGYLIQYRLQGDKGKFYYEYELLDEPNSLQTAEKSHSIHTPKKEGVDNGVGGKRGTAKRGVYNNTNLNNTNLNNTNLNNTTKCQHQDACSTSIEIDSNSNINLIENNTHLKLSNNQVEKINSWDIIRLRKSIEIFKEQEGKYFALLEKIYLDNGNFVPKSNKSATTTYNNSKPSNFANFKQREYDYNKLEKQLLGWDDEDEDEEE